MRICCLPLRACAQRPPSHQVAAARLKGRLYAYYCATPSWDKHGASGVCPAPDMLRVAAVVEYDGTEFSGWETQTNAPTVQAAVDNALSRVADHDVRTVCAGRTDAGVHAWGQVVHFDTSAVRSSRNWVLGANSNLPKSVSLVWCSEVSEAFHARFSATARHYRYIVWNRPVRPAVLHHKAVWECAPLDEIAMQTAAKALAGEHDFSSFRAAACQARNPVRRIRELNVVRHGDAVVLDVVANAFLYHMVRNIAGVLIAIGAGKRDTGWAAEVLHARDRRAGGVTAPAHGLYLTKVDYPHHFEIAELPRPGVLW